MLNGIRANAGNAVYGKRTNAVLAALNNKQGMVPIAFLDLVFSSGRIYQEFKRDYNGGMESLNEELTTTAIWAGGIPLGIRAMNKLAPKMSDKIALPNLNLTLFQKGKDKAQELSPSIINEYLPAKNLPKEISSKARENLVTMVGKDGGKLLLGNHIFQFAKISGIGCLVSAALGFGLPKLNQKITKVRIAKQQEKAKETQNPKQPAPTPFGTANPYGFPAPVSRNNPFAQTAFAANSNLYFPTTSPKSGTNGVRFGGSAELAGTILQKFQNSDKLSTLCFSDLPLSGGRIATTRNKDEQIEKIIKEVGLIGILFFLSSHLEGFFSGNLKEVSYPGLKHLYDKFGKDDAAFLMQYKNAIAQGGNYQKLAEQVGHNKEFIEKVRDYFHPDQSKHSAENLLFEAAEAAGKIPTFNRGKGVRNYIDITQKIDMDGIKAVAEFLDKVAGKATTAAEGKVSQELVGELRNAALHKVGAFAGSTAICWTLMSYALPKLQHWVTYKRTGRDFFPGVQ